MPVMQLWVCLGRRGGSSAVFDALQCSTHCAGEKDNCGHPLHPPTSQLPTHPSYPSYTPAWQTFCPAPRNCTREKFTLETATKRFFWVLACPWLWFSFLMLKSDHFLLLDILCKAPAKAGCRADCWSSGLNLEKALVKKYFQNTAVAFHAKTKRNDPVFLAFDWWARDLADKPTPYATLAKKLHLYKKKKRETWD